MLNYSGVALKKKILLTFNGSNGNYKIIANDAGFMYVPSKIFPFLFQTKRVKARLVEMEKDVPTKDVLLGSEGI